MVVIVRLVLAMVVIAAIASASGASARQSVSAGFLVLIGSLAAVALWAHLRE